MHEGASATSEVNLTIDGHGTWPGVMQGRFLAVAGFGNLPGDILFFDKKPDGKLKQMGATR